MSGYTLLLATFVFVGCIVLLYFAGSILEGYAFLKGEKNGEAPKENSTVGGIFAISGMVFLILSCYTISSYSDIFLNGSSASEEGELIDAMTNSTFFWTFIVFLGTQLPLFLFAYVYRKNKSRKAIFYPHNNKLEVIWTVVPSIVLTFLIVQAYNAWDEIMFDKDEDYVVEVTAQQFGWIIRYPGADGELGKKSFELTDDGNNQLGIDFNDPKSHDDLMITDTLVLPKGKEVLVKLKSRDVLHSFYLPHFRVKMDCVPGTPTHFRFTPKYTSEEYRTEFNKKEDWNFELACTEMCGSSHYGMQKPVKVVSEEDYRAWVASKTAENSTYYSVYK